MQLFALEAPSLYPDQKEPILAHEAEKGKDYLCPECNATLRVRGGRTRQIHFFHLKNSSICRQHQKGIVHLNLQLHLEELLANEGAKLEYHFPAIGRIADVACLKTKRIFEIQYSPISLNEAQSRSKDYESLGFQIIWILHDRRFNKRTLSSAEEFLRQGMCYFTNMDHEKRGLIYDQFEILKDGKRVFRGNPLRIDLKSPKKMSGAALDLPFAIQKRLTKHSMFHHGDLVDRFFSGGLSAFIFKLEEKFLQKKETLSFWKKMKHGYDLLFHFLLNGAI